MQESMISRTSPSVARIFAVIVIYKLRPFESSTLQTLLNAARQTSLVGLELGILVWDNTPGGQYPGEIPPGVQYESRPENPGLACAYNQALEIANAEGYDWLLTLDQDSVLPLNFLVRIAELARKFRSTPTVAAIVPQVKGDGRNLSPFYFAGGIVPRWFPFGFTGIPQRATYALNSAATLRVAAVREIGGYDPMYPLDVSDINLFHRLHRSGKGIFVAGDLLISHDFSLLKKHRRMSIERYHALLLDECAFWDLNMGPLARLERMIRLAGRTCRDLATPEERAFRNLTLVELKRRLLTPRAQRIVAWKDWATARYTSSAQAADPQSLCLRENPIDDTPCDCSMRPNESEIQPKSDGETPLRGNADKARIVVSGVSLTEMGPLAVFKDALESLASHYSEEYKITALVHRRSLLDIPNVTYLEFPDVKSSWFKRLRFEYWTSKAISHRIQPQLWLSMDNMTPNVSAEIQAVYCHNPSPFYAFRFRDLWLDWKFGLFTLFYRYLYAVNIERNDHVIVQQDWIRRSFERLYHIKNVIVAHPTVHVPTSRAGPAQGKPEMAYRFFYPAFPRPFKNAEVALEAAELLEKSGFYDFELWLTFDTSVNRYASEIGQRFAHVQSVRWLGLLPRQQVFALYEKADCLLFPSKLETWGLPITEFKATGKPILGADLPYAHETVGNYEQAVFFDPGKADELAAIMEAAARGKPVFSAVTAKAISSPFATDWTELWSLLLPQDSSTAESRATAPRDLHLATTRR